MPAPARDQNESAGPQGEGRDPEGRPSGRNETEDERLDRNLGELLQELRVALPGVQVLFAFLLAVPFQQHFTSIRDEGKIYSACADGKISFVSANDIAAVAYRALTDEQPHNCDHRVLGPELLTYDQVCQKFMTLIPN